METSSFARQEKVQNASIHMKAHDYSFWDSKGPQLENYRNRDLSVNSARYSEMLYNKLSPKFEANKEDYCQEALCCCTTMPGLTLFPTC